MFIFNHFFICSYFSFLFITLILSFLLSVYYFRTLLSSINLFFTLYSFTNSKFLFHNCFVSLINLLNYFSIVKSIFAFFVFIIQWTLQSSYRKFSFNFEVFKHFISVFPESNSKIFIHKFKLFNFRVFEIIHLCKLIFIIDDCKLFCFSGFRVSLK